MTMRIRRIINLYLIIYFFKRLLFEACKINYFFVIGAAILSLVKVSMRFPFENEESRGLTCFFVSFPNNSRGIIAEIKASILSFISALIRET